MKHPLEAYLARKGMSLRALADMAGTTATSLSRIINEQQTPSLGLVGRLIDATGGELTADDFLPKRQESEAAA